MATRPTPGPSRAAPGAREGAAFLLSLMAFALPALGVPGEWILQDTFKSLLAALLTLQAALLFFWRRRAEATPLRWHPMLWAPLALAAWAAGSMAWSHAYLGGVEAIRWSLFALAAWLGLNLFTRERAQHLLWGIHLGAVAASAWAALQFWFDWRFFGQGPNPGSTFVNRNFFAEYAVCALPFSALLLARQRAPARIAGLAASLGLVLVALGMAGTRSALVALGLLALVAAPVAVWRCGGHGWSRAQWRLAAGALAATVLLLGSLPTGNPRIAAEGRGETALARAVSRGQSIGPGDPSLGVRQGLWRASVAMAAAHPLAGVGAGAWEVHLPRFQAPGSALEADFYAHDEYLQLIAEYGLVGWAVLAAAFAGLVAAAARTLRRREPAMEDEAPLRCAALASLLALAVVSLVGFPLRLAGTGSLAALALGLLLASDARLAPAGRLGARLMTWRPLASRLGVGASVAALGLAVWIGAQAIECEARLVRATRKAMEISDSGRPDDPRWASDKLDLLEDLRAAIAINPHYRKITPQAADELARWGAWAEATWIWESVLRSRPYVVALLANAARGHAQLGDEPGAWQLLARAQAVQPDAAPVRSLEVVLLARAGRQAEALARARQALAAGIADADLTQAAFVLARRAGDAALAREAMARAPQPQRAWMERELAAAR